MSAVMDEPTTLAEPEGLYAVVQAWAQPWPHEAGPAEPEVYIKAPGAFGDYWYIPGSEDGWSWEQVVHRSVHVEFVREGMPAEATP